jgi:hypothetical protein
LLLVIIQAERAVRLATFLTTPNTSGPLTILSPLVPAKLALKQSPENPALPPRKIATLPSRFRPPPELELGVTTTPTIPVGAKRIYLEIQSQYPNVAYPPRPVPGSIVDFDIIMQHCDFSEKKVCDFSSSFPLEC